jgi:Arf-GAP with dual PH domain-containing protein
VKHLKLDRWEDSQVEHMKEVGNVAAKFKYEERVPSCYRRPTEFDPQYAFILQQESLLQFIFRVLLEQWIKAKYERHEFSHPENQVYTSGFMKGFLMKRGKDDNKYHPRMFILEEKDGTLRYFVKEVCSSVSISCQLCSNLGYFCRKRNQRPY